MQTIEFGTTKRGLHEGWAGSQFAHARRDPELRKHREAQHEHNKNMAQSERPELNVLLPVVEQRRGQKNYTGYQSHPVQLGQRRAHHVAGELCRWQSSEERGCFDKGKENDPADPYDQRQQHEKS